VVPGGKPGASPATAPRVGRRVLPSTGRSISDITLACRRCSANPSPVRIHRLARTPCTAPLPSQSRAANWRVCPKHRTSPPRRSKPKLTHQLVSQPCTINPGCYRQLVGAPLPVHRHVPPATRPCTRNTGRINDDRVPHSRFPLPFANAWLNL
jgi:hypothetical protein